MITVIIPTLNADRNLPDTLTSLFPAVVDGIIKTVIVSDGGSTDNTINIAEQTGCAVVIAKRGRGTQMIAALPSVKSDWMLFLHADTILQDGWEIIAAKHVAMEERLASSTTNYIRKAGWFRFRLNMRGWKARLLEMFVACRCNLLALPYGDQGLLVHRDTYNKFDGFPDIPIMEDLVLVRNIGRRNLLCLGADAITSAEKFEKNGVFGQVLTNLRCLYLYYRGCSPAKIASIYTRNL